MENKIEFYKWNKLGSLSFQLVDTECQESYSVWNNKEKKFMRSGHLPDGTTVEDSKYIVKEEWTRKFGTDYNKNNQYIYNVLVNDVEHKLGVGHGVHKQIVDKLDTLNSAGVHFKGITFIIESNDKPGLDRRYLVKTANNNSSLDSDKVDEIKLSDEETKLVEGAKSFGNVDEAKFITFMKAQIPNATEERAKEIHRAFF